MRIASQHHATLKARTSIERRSQRRDRIIRPIDQQDRKASLGPKVPRVPLCRRHPPLRARPGLREEDIGEAADVLLHFDQRVHVRWRVGAELGVRAGDAPEGERAFVPFGGEGLDPLGVLVEGEVASDDH